MLDERLIHSLHVTSGEHGELPDGAEPHEVFQTSTLAALLDGALDGDISFGELARHGDLGLGTFDAADGEMLMVDGEFFRCDAAGNAGTVPPERKTPFACLVEFTPTHRFELPDPLDHEGLIAELDRHLGDPEEAHAIRIDGRFERVHARSVPRQSKPYPPMTEVVESQHVFDFTDVEGTMVGFRFPDFAAQLNVPGYHLHFITADRARGGHVLACSPAGVEIAIDDETKIRLELPTGVDLGKAASAEALDRVEHRD
ncbi:MAG: acetolactate decarboxylase [Solirubrobacterales bacterium]